MINQATDDPEDDLGDLSEVRSQKTGSHDQSSNEPHNSHDSEGPNEALNLAV